MSILGVLIARVNSCFMCAKEIVKRKNLDTRELKKRLDSKTKTCAQTQQARLLLAIVQVKLLELEFIEDKNHMQPETEDTQKLKEKEKLNDGEETALGVAIGFDQIHDDLSEIDDQLQDEEAPLQDMVKKKLHCK